MPFRAELHGREVSSLRCDDATWCAARAESKRGGHALVLAHCCGARAVATTSKLGTRYFAHRAKGPCERPAETIEHLELKAAALKAALDAGWEAQEEACQRAIDGIDGVVPEVGGFEVDVLARKGRALIGLEVQLTRQGAEETARREQVYLQAGIMPYWLVGPGNQKRSFGSEKRAPIEGETLDERIRSMARTVRQLLLAAERQVAIARTVKARLRFDGWEARVESCARIPVLVEASKGADRQTIVIGELGRGVLSQRPQEIAKRHKQFAGAVVQLHSQSVAVSGFGAAALSVSSSNIVLGVESRLRRVLDGSRVWRGHQHVEWLSATFVGYEDACHRCDARYYRAPFVAGGVDGGPEGVGLQVQPLNISTLEELREVVKSHDERLGVTSGRFVEGLTNWRNGRRETTIEQCCPKCGAFAAPSLITAREAQGWPHAAADFVLKHPLPGNGWERRLMLCERELPSVAAWEQMISKRRASRDAAIRQGRLDEAARRERQRLEAAEVVRQQAEARRLAELDAERQAALDAAERKACAALRREMAEAEWRARARATVEEAAMECFMDAERAGIWLNGAHPELERQPPKDYALRGQTELDACLALLRAAASRVRKGRPHIR